MQKIHCGDDGSLFKVDNGDTDKKDDRDRRRSNVHLQLDHAV